MIDLNKFCSKGGNDPREWLTRPFRWEGMIVATNAHVLISIPDDGRELPENDGPATFALDRFRLRPNDLSPVDVAHIDVPPREPCKGCGGSGVVAVRECPECDGQGAFWYRAYEYECMECDGAGTLSDSAASAAPGEKTSACQVCDGLGEAWFFNDKMVRVGDAFFQSRYLALLSVLPGCKLYTDGAEGTARFTFDGGFGALMPCRP